MEELIPMRFDWKVFDSSLAVARKEDFQRLLGAIDDGSWDEGERASLEGRARAVFTSYAGFFDSLEICQIEYGTHNPFNIPENPAGAWSDILVNMETKVKQLNGIAARRERASTGKALNSLELGGKNGEQHDRILKLFATLYARAECGEIDGVSGSDVEALAKVYAEIRTERPEASEYERLEEILVGKEMEWFELNEELGYLEIPETRPTVTEWDAAWEVSRAVVQTLRANEVSKEELVEKLKLDPVVVERRKMIAEWDGEIEVPELEGEEAAQDLRILAGFDRLYAGGQTEEVEELELLYVALRTEWYDVRRFAALEQLMVAEKIDWAAVVQEMEYLELPASRPHEGDHIHLQGLGWFASRLFKSEEIDLDQALNDVYRLGDGKLTWGEFLEEGGPLLWKAMKDDSGESFDWGALKGATEYPQNDIDPNSIGWRHAAWVVTQLSSKEPLTWKQFQEKIGYEGDDQAEFTGAEAAWLVSRMFSKKELAWEPVEKDLVYLANPDNRASIGGLGMAWSGALAFWRTQKWIASEGITWKNLEKVVGTKKPYEDNDEVVSAKHLVWLGIKLFESDEVSFEKFDQHLTELIDPENRKDIGWWQLAKMGVKALWRAMVGSPSKNEEKEEELIMLEPLTKKFPSLKAKLRSIDGVLVAKLALGLVALVGIGLIAYNFEAIQDSLTGEPVVPDAPSAPVTPIPVLDPPPIEKPPVIVDKPPVVSTPIPVKDTHQGLHLHDGVWGWG